MLQLDFSNFPLLQTERLHLREVRDSDVEQVFAIRSSADMMRYICRPLAKTLDDAQGVINIIRTAIENGKGINWAITEKGTDKLIGIIGYVTFNETSHRAEVGYILHSDHHRKGIVSEALQAVTDYGFKGIKLHAIEAVVHTENTASFSLLEKAGFNRDAMFKDYMYRNGEYIDAFVYTIIDPA